MRTETLRLRTFTRGCDMQKEEAIYYLVSASVTIFWVYELFWG